jgi:hypothetical protein
MVRPKIISRETYDRIFEEQGGVCAICEEFPIGRELAVDHDHTTRAVRGLLCMRCNTGLGHFHDSIEILDRAIEYLSDHHLTVTLTDTDQLLRVVNGRSE